MIYKLFTTLKCYGAIVITLLTANAVSVNSTEYVFTAPPEVDNEIVEIPASETDYPLYECNPESENKDTEAAKDSHNCDCADCEGMAEDSEQSENFTSQNQENR
ncbi:MAG: hypothetical protein QNJ53_02495 [Pleurocapsa sp. MO_192.B19]|nr:hypothetical protein [Pleurocapsa sp. MO_192.B19]